MLKPKNIVSDQKAFFNANASQQKLDRDDSFFSRYINKEQKNGFLWLSDRNKLLDFGCGVGTSINYFNFINPNSNVQFIGVDIAENAIKIAKETYPSHQFHLISDNQIPLENDFLPDGSYLLHVLHHSTDHRAIFLSIYQALSPGGKFFLSDLSSNNPFIAISRKLFGYLPKSVAAKFGDDLVVDGAIPEKYRVEIARVKEELASVGFINIEIGYGHLFFFLFDWVDKFIPLEKYQVFRSVYSRLINLEEYLLTKRFFKKYAEVFYIKCIKE